MGSHYVAQFGLEYLVSNCSLASVSHIARSTGAHRYFWLKRWHFIDSEMPSLTLESWGKSASEILETYGRRAASGAGGVGRSVESHGGVVQGIAKGRKFRVGYSAGMMVHTCNSSTWSWGRRIALSYRAAWTYMMRPYIKRQSKGKWGPVGMIVIFLLA